ncbi:hypothetical protein CW304_02700 [Bacillus sp. UFRGS-B20]|nr:hypothetical protein CW304_02700 [Bacillus sp. UFRGS-B20]
MSFDSLRHAAFGHSPDMHLVVKFVNRIPQCKWPHVLHYFPLILSRINHKIRNVLAQNIAHM